MVMMRGNFLFPPLERTVGLIVLVECEQGLMRGLSLRRELLMNK